MSIKKQVAEFLTIKNLIVKKYPSGIVSLVADSFDYWAVLTKIVPLLRDEILARTPDALGLAKVVIRPDSGDPVKIVAGLIVADGLDEMDGTSEAALVDGKYYEVEMTNENRHGFKAGKELPKHVVDGSIQVLWDIFGGTESDKGYKLLNERIGLIYGDSITLVRAEEILRRLEAKGFASTNIVFGIGSYTYQYNTRDTFGFAMKATWGMVDDEERAIFKDPKTDNGTKKSARGLIAVQEDENGFKLVDDLTLEEYQETDNAMQLVFIDGKLHNQVNIAQVRERLAVG